MPDAHHFPFPPPCLCLSMKLCTNTAIPDPVNLELKYQSRTFTPHVKSKVQIIKLYTLGRRQPSEKAFGNGIQVCGQSANINESFGKRIRCDVGVASDKIVFYDERLARTEIACVVERYWAGFRDLCALGIDILAGKNGRGGIRIHLCNMPLHSIGHHPAFPEGTPVAI